MCRKGSLTAAPLTFWAGQVFVGGLSVHRRVFRASLASVHQTDANSTALPPPDSITTTQIHYSLVHIDSPIYWHHPFLEHLLCAVQRDNAANLPW